MTSLACYTRTLLLSTTLALGTAATAQASTFAWEFSGRIGAPDGTEYISLPFPNDFVPTGFTHSGAGTDTLTWGNPNLPGGGAPAGVTTAPVSSLSIVPVVGGSQGLTSGTDTEIRFGSMSWTNMPNWGTGGVWDTQLTFNLSFSAGLLPALQIDPIVLSIQVNNTPDPQDRSVTPYQERLNNIAAGTAPDVITVLNGTGLGLLSGPIDLGGGVQITGLTARLFDTGQCGTAASQQNTSGSSLIGNIWTNCEGHTSDLGFYATIRYDAPDVPEDPVAPIPLPAAGWLLLGGLAGLGALRARRRAA